jgi:hypothetical protein
MAYRQYFPALSLAEGGRPYSIAEFATEKHERGSQEAVGYTDLELGQTQRGSQARQTGAWHESDSASDADARVLPVIRIQNEDEDSDPLTSGFRHLNNQP